MDTHTHRERERERERDEICNVLQSQGTRNKDYAHVTTDHVTMCDVFLPVVIKVSLILYHTIPFRNPHLEHYPLIS